MANAVDTTAATTGGHYQLAGSPAAGLTMGTWGFFIGFAAVALYGPAAQAFQEQMQLGGLALGLLVAAPQLTGSLLRIPFGAWVDQVGGRLPMLTLFGMSIVGMWGLVFILVTVKTLTVAAYPIIMLFGFMSGCGVAVVLGRHSAGVVLVPAVTARHGAWHLWRRRQSGAGHVHAAAALRHRRLGTGRLLSRLARVPADRRRGLWLACPRRLLLPIAPAGFDPQTSKQDRRREGRGTLSKRARLAGRHYRGGRTAHLGTCSCTSSPSAGSWR